MCALCKYGYTQASVGTCRTVQQSVASPLRTLHMRPRCAPHCEDVLRSLRGTCEAFLWAVRLAAFVCVSWGSVCLGPLLAGSRGSGTSVSMLMCSRCGPLSQVVRGNSSPGERKTVAALCGGPAPRHHIPRLRLTSDLMNHKRKLKLKAPVKRCSYMFQATHAGLMRVYPKIKLLLPFFAAFQSHGDYSIWENRSYLLSVEHVLLTGSSWPEFRGCRFEAEIL